jgi:Rrf2 family iron-sulfur cluster assembly transcriptional regulator
VDGVNLAKSTRYALYAAVEMAAAGDRPVTVADVAQRYRIPPNALAKVFQQLVRAGVAVGTRGVGGGYRLGRPADVVSVLDVVSVFEPPREVGVCALTALPSGDCEASVTCRLRRLFDEVDEMVRCTYASVSLETLVRAPAAPRARA